jgi:hypothetical protein
MLDGILEAFDCDKVFKNSDNIMLRTHTIKKDQFLISKVIRRMALRGLREKK